jgi:hypothetical protein
MMNHLSFDQRKLNLFLSTGMNGFKKRKEKKASQI